MANLTPNDQIDPSSLAYYLDNTSFGILLWNPAMKLSYCSKKAQEIFGFSSEEVPGSISLWQLVQREDMPRVSELMGQITAGKSTHNQGRSRNLTKDGRIIYCQWYHSANRDGKGELLNILSLCQDVTTEVETELTLRKTQELALAFNSAIDPMWLIRMDGPNAFWFESINVAFTKVTGWSAEQVEGQPIESVMPAASHELVREKYNEALLSGKIIDYVEEAQHPSGVKYGEIRVIPVRGENGEKPRILGIANDITEKVYLQKKLEAEREARNRQITAAAIRGQEGERAKVGRELHDNVNQVLTTVKLYLELAMDSQTDSTVIFRKCVTLLNNTITEIRQLSKQLSAPSLGNVNLKETLTDLLDSLQSTTQMEVRLKMDPLTCLEMESELHLALYRIAQEQFTNIVKYARASQVEVCIMEEGSLLHFTIQDNGVGFNTEQKRKGIGITNMKSRVEILNGRFQIESKLGSGTRIDVKIPVIIEENVCYAEQTVLNLVAN